MSTDAEPAGRPSSAGSAPDRPNIVLILADDLGWSDIGCYGAEVRTPNIDGLAEDGVSFTQFYNTGKCFPSRACALTGVYAQQCGMGRRHGVIENAVTLGEVLRTAGYRTLWSGKHHGTENPVNRGFDHFYGLRDGACNYFNPGYQREGEPKPAQKRYGKRFWCIDGETYQPYTPEVDDFYTTDYFTKYALDWLDEGEGDERPFFLYLAYNAPHDPLQAWPEDIRRYEGRYEVGYAEVRRARYRRQLEAGLIEEETAPLSEREHPLWEELDAEERATEARRMAVYAAMIDRMDRNIGKVLDKVRELGEEENTLVLFCSDNGASAEVVRKGSGPIGSITRWASLRQPWANVANAPLRKYKNWSHEGGVCTPLVARWPAGIAEAGRLSRHVGHFIDFMATFIDMTGADYPSRFNAQDIVPLQGRSFLPALRGKEPPPRDEVFWQWGKGRAVRRGRWKLVSWRGDWELYDMERDRTETNDLAGENAALVKDMSRTWHQWYATCYPGDTYPED